MRSQSSLSSLSSTDRLPPPNRLKNESRGNNTEASDAFPPIDGKFTNDDLLAIREVLLPILMLIPYDQLMAVHPLTELITSPVRYSANHGTTFLRPLRLPLYDLSIADDATTVVRV